MRNLVLWHMYKASNFLMTARKQGRRLAQSQRIPLRDASHTKNEQGLCDRSASHKETYQQHFLFDNLHKVCGSFTICFGISTSDSFIKTFLECKHG